MSRSLLLLCLNPNRSCRHVLPDSVQAPERDGVEGFKDPIRSQLNVGVTWLTNNWIRLSILCKMAVDVVRKLSKLVLSNNNQQQKEIVQQTIDTLSREDILRAVPDIVHSNGAPNLIRLVLEGLS
ncbi:hypothetical protein OUZ56_007696 [Daphnia magna]|uniref:Uncharacterized protein n=1 Tax=Daphnia magna TaxID=35525 RepID=A0ABR0AAR8_9CRUS|nr:hypothetical protein OUZ56_007696 [Daphnia magna]